MLSGVAVPEEGVRIELRGVRDFSRVGDGARGVDLNDDSDSGQSAGWNVSDSEGLGEA